jgi:hypothetical protein
MGFRLSWIAVRGVPKDQVLAWMNLAGTGKQDDTMSASFCGAQLTGWYVVVANRNLEFATEENLFNLSRGCEAIGCVVEEHVMRCEVVCYRDASFAWRADYFGEEGPDETALDADGALPPQWAAIRDAKVAMQKTAEPDEDNYFDAPLELAKALCGFRHDEIGYELSHVKFTALKDAAPSAPGSSGGWLKKIFGGR